MSTTALSPVPLTRADRCDRCGAGASSRVMLESGGELLFCGHHLRAHSDALIERGALIHSDE